MSRVVMTTDQGMFVMADSDVDEEELKSFISRKFTKAKKLKKNHTDTGNTQKSSSLTSTPASSPPDSDSNTSGPVASSSLPEGISPMEAGQNNKRKRQNEEDEVLSDRKKLKSVVCAVYPQNKTSESNWSDTDSKTKQQVPGAWKSINSSHYIFSSDEELSESETVGKTSNRDCQREVFATVNAKNNINQQHKSDVTSQKCKKSKKKKKVLKLSSMCLISCNSCSRYTLPVLCEQESIEMDCYLALDCEFVGVGPKKTSSLGRCSIVDHRGEVVFDQFVKPSEKITDYRTPWSGLHPHHIQRGIPFLAAQEKIAAIIKNKVVVGHAVHNDFKVMGLQHPVHLIRDTASCMLLREMAKLPNNACALRKLTSALLGRTIQKKEHCSVTDARACLDLFRLVRTQWEPILQEKLNRRAKRQSAKVKATDNVNSSETDPELNSFFDDQYWPDDMFKEPC